MSTGGGGGTLHDVVVGVSEWGHPLVEQGCLLVEVHAHRKNLAQDLAEVTRFSLRLYKTETKILMSLKLIYYLGIHPIYGLY